MAFHGHYNETMLKEMLFEDLLYTQYHDGSLSMQRFHGALSLILFPFELKLVQEIQ